ncbi:MAG: hypothetical protein ACRDKH_05670 [Solirubrobacterales bacterium]
MTTLESPRERLGDALRRLAVEASDLFEELIAAGAELPFEIEPSDEGPLPMYSYAPLTGEFIRDRVAELRRLEAFVEVRELGSEELAVGFLVGLWEGRAEFEIAGERLEGAIDGALAMAGSDSDATPSGEVIVPLIGFHMPTDEIEIDGVRILRADAVADAPGDAIEATRQGRSGKPGFIASVSCGYAGVAPAAAVADDLQRALRTLRLFRPGAVALAPHGWVRRSDGWERFGTGAGRARNGGYRLTGNEAGELEAFSRRLAERSARIPSLSWAISRFDLGAERSSLIEALSDYLLALRGLLEGGGKIKAALPARVPVLACEPHERGRAQECVERALKMERKLMSGARYRPAAETNPLRVIADLEELLRRILNKLATGELQGDLRAKADELLLAEGMTAAAPSRPTVEETGEWRLPDPGGDDEFDLSAVSDGNIGEIEIRRADVAPESEPSGEGGTGVGVHEPAPQEPTTRIVVTDVELPEIMEPDQHPEPPERPEPEKVFEPSPEPSAKADWFESADGELEWPAFASPRRGREGEQHPSEPSDRVRYLFPVPDATDWDVGELRYERRSGRST